MVLLPSQSPSCRPPFSRVSALPAQLAKVWLGLSRLWLIQRDGVNLLEYWSLPGDSVLRTFSTYIPAAGIARNSQLSNPLQTRQYRPFRNCTKHPPPPPHLPFQSSYLTVSLCGPGHIRLRSQQDSIWYDEIAWVSGDSI